jgi:hypothetical protein
MKNYFSLFNLEPSAVIDEAFLLKTYLHLQKKYHPDAKDGNKEQAQSVNIGYGVLKDEVSRVEHFLELVQVELASYNIETDILENIMQLKMEFDDNPDGVILQVKSRLAVMMEVCISACSRKNFAVAARTLNEVKYLKKLFPSI